MKNTIRIAVAAALLLLVGERGLAAEKSNAKAEFQEVFAKVQVKLKDGKNTEKDLADNLKEFDDLLAKYKDEKTDEVAQILFMKAMLYLQVIEDTEKGAQLVNQLKSDFPETTQGKKADDIIASLKQQEAAKNAESHYGLQNPKSRSSS